MDKNIFQPDETIVFNKLELQLAFQCAPLLSGIKVSNLLIVQYCHKRTVIEIFHKTMILHYVLYETMEKVVFFLYNKEHLQEYLNRNEVKMLMTHYAYKSNRLLYVLKEFTRKYRYYMNYRGEFPHEIGLLLGYPVDDVKGFIDNEGKCSLYTGYWKVYSNLQETIKVFEKYNHAKELLIQLVRQGTSIRSIIEYDITDYMQMW